MQAEQKVKYLSEFYVCMNPTCMQPVNICHKDYFGFYHVDVVNNKKVTH